MHNAAIVPEKCLSSADLLSRTPAANISNIEKGVISVVKVHIKLMTS